MLARMKTLHTDETTEIILTVPKIEYAKVTQAIAGIFNLSGHRLIDDEDIDDNKRYSIEEAFPDLCPATVLHGARLRCDLTQTELAEKLGIKQSHISEMESGRRHISRKMAAKLGKLFNLSTETFISSQLIKI
jgi:DNA-binding XRE family transcriptional regulator